MPPMLLTAIKGMLTHDTHLVLNSVSTNNALSSMGVERVRACEQGRRFYESLLCHASNPHPHDPALIKQRPGVTHTAARAARCDLPRLSSMNDCSQHLPSRYLTNKF
jgi:hypothetical protein